MPYGAFSITDRKLASERDSASDARFRSEMSRFTMMSFSGLPSAFLTTLEVDSNTRHVPSLCWMRYSSGRAVPVVRMSLFDPRRALKFFRRVPQNFLVRHAVVDSRSFHVHDGDHVGGVLVNQSEEFFSLE